LKDELGVVSGLVFSVFGALICTMLFSGEPRTYGQLVSVAIGTSLGSTKWWKGKPHELHFYLIVMMIIVTILAGIRNQIVGFAKQIYLWTTSKLLQST